MANDLVLRLGTRGSLLARTQSQQVADIVMAATPGVRVELVILKTTGDQVQDRPLADIGGKGLFTKELEQALLDGRVDFAVHSYKDVPVTMPLVDVSDLVIASVPQRADPGDVLLVQDVATNRVASLSVDRLPLSARVGTGSLRRQCQLLARRPDLRIEGVRGNIDTRLRKLAGGEFDAIVLAAAGLKRAGFWNDSSMTPLSLDEMIPSPGQGALAIQCRRDDVSTRRYLMPLHDERTARCVDLERAIVLGLNGDCHSPIAAYAEERDGDVRLTAAYGPPGGGLPVKRLTATGRQNEADRLVADVLNGLR